MSPKRRATLTDVAREARVSLKTASRVINGVKTVSPQMQEQVREAAALLGYRPHRGAATIRSGTSDMVGMIIRDMSNDFYAALAAGAAEEAEKHRCLLITCSSEGLPERQNRLVEAVFAQRPRGLLITPTSAKCPMIETEFALGTPVVAIDEHVPNVDVDIVQFDNFNASKEATIAAIDSGRRDFAVLSDGEILGTMPARVDGVKSALAERDLSVRDGLNIDYIHSESQARSAVSRILTLAQPPDAIFCANNVAARGAAAQIHDSGRDIAIVSFDNFPLSHTQNVPVFVIEHDDRAVGATAAGLLFERMKDPDRPSQTITIETVLRLH